MATLDYMIYDTALVSTTAGVEHILFQVGQGAQPTKGKQITNMRGSGSFPEQEKFTVRRIGVTPDDIFSADDLLSLYHFSLLTIEYNNVKVLEAPLQCFADKASFGGVNSQGSATDFSAFGTDGNGYMFNEPLVIQGGKNIRATVLQGIAVDSADLRLKVVMYGTLDSPDINIT